MTEWGISTNVRFVHDVKALSSIVVRDLERVTEENPQPTKAYFPIVVTELGMVREVKLLHPQKAFSPILVTESGMITDCNLVQSKKVLSLISVTKSGIVTEVKLLQL